MSSDPIPLKTIARPRHAMILAAGIGKRMRPVTATVPKPLIEVAGRPLIDRALDRLMVAGVEEVVVNVHYLADLVETHVKKRKTPRVIVSDERSGLLETGGGVTKALPLLGDKPFYVMNSDSFWIEGPRPNLDWLAAGWDDERMDAILMLAPTVASIGYSGPGDFEMDKEGRLARRVERTIAPFVYSGAAILSPRLFEGAPEGSFSLNLLFDKAIAAGRLYGIRMDGIWLHVGTPEAIREAELSVAESAA
ncbi:nucleotidyltransferase family protein [Kaistia dalseonensis]|uniref:MurNAc alpha-1-phosphate uridylyltransferase n=1 Tax=Kaistia dalseonensis TaxID=410840 RepID=A0ABU0H5B7_9HYPH|nr:nucleotidyltransferase family protein [Kaistia dalseonensis]MCX5494930.1 nucleotidyltransferase family protein [Kaistia dalseonensis]MDQ0437511.1 MurNAc alpha-1-phosphate uridylyltransferase [Kaistia dalseonensis]